jgi:hypothetical protein
MRGLGLLLFSALLSLLVINANDLSASGQTGVDVKADVDEIEVPTDQLITLTVTVDGVIEQLGDPILPLLDGMQILTSTRSSWFSLVDGTITSHAVFSYRLRPVEPGIFTIPSISVDVNGATYGTKPIIVSVTQAAPTDSGPLSAGESRAESVAESNIKPRVETCPSTHQPSPYGGLPGKDLYVTAGIGSLAPFVGESLVYCFHFYQAVNLSEPPQLEWPSFNGFLVEDMDSTGYFERTATERQYRVTEVRKVLYPALAGPITIEPTTLTVSDHDREIVLKTDSLKVNVQPLPVGAPNGFTGAVGQFDIDAWVEPEEVQAHEPVTLSLRVTGAGNFATVSDPANGLEDSLVDWQMFSSSASTELNADVQGEKVFERLLLPRTAGDLVIPKMTLTFFDPKRREYRQANTKALVVHVMSGNGDTTSTPDSGPVGEDTSSPGKETQTSENALAALRRLPSDLISHPAYWLMAVVAPIVLLVAWLWDRHRRSSNTFTSTDLEDAALQRALDELVRAQDQNAGDEQDGFAGVARALAGFLGETLIEPPAGLTRDVIFEALTARHIPRSLAERTLLCLDAADAGRFAPVATDRSLEALAEETKAVILELRMTTRNS